MTSRPRARTYVTKARRLALADGHTELAITVAQHAAAQRAHLDQPDGEAPGWNASDGEETA